MQAIRPAPPAQVKKSEKGVIKNRGHRSPASEGTSKDPKKLLVWVSKTPGKLNQEENCNVWENY
jgi:hypothetical protein